MEKSKSRKPIFIGLAILYIFITLIILLLIGLPIATYYVNNYYAYRVEKTLVNTPLPENTILIESTNKAGKLEGNGNGMQYYGAILIQSDLELDELDEYYSNYRNNDWEYIVEVQDSPLAKGVSHSDIYFSNYTEDGNYYIVYSWGSGDEFFSIIDIRGNIIF